MEINKIPDNLKWTFPTSVEVSLIPYNDLNAIQLCPGAPFTNMV